MSNPQNWRGKSKEIAWRMHVGPVARGQALQLQKTVRSLLKCRVRVVPVTNEIAAQPLIEGPLIAAASIATLPNWWDFSAELAERDIKVTKRQ
ncbi:hypothetical protein BGLT_06813 [Caballeronia glathei]|nr:hypothetical protein BGLT_06813 [Caballeronia glathei]